MSRRWARMFSAAAMVGASLAITPVAAGPVIWFATDIGAPSARGSTHVDASGVWTIKGGGDPTVWGSADNFQYAYQRVAGDVSITGRFLTMDGGHPEWAMAGLMIRENDSTGSRNVFFCMTSLHGLHASARFGQGEGAGMYWEVGPSRRRERNLQIRLQRVASELAGFYSRDGVVWSQAFGPVPLPDLSPEMLVGLAVTSHQAGVVTTAQFDQIDVQPEPSLVYGILGCGTNQAVSLQWRPLKNAVGYNVYRGPAGASRDQFVKLNTSNVVGASFTDTSDGLENGVPLTYAIAAIFPGTNGALVEGPLAATQATPQAVPPGFTGCSILEGVYTGAATSDPTTGRIDLQGSGGDIWNNGDQFFFLTLPVDGDVQITVKVLVRPALTSIWSKAGLMIRESLEPGARNMFVALTGSQGLITQWRLAIDGRSDYQGSPGMSDAMVRLPMILRLTRRSNTMIPEYSIDDGKTFLLAGPRLTVTPPLAKTLAVGLAICATDRSQVTTASFSGLQIRKL